MKRLLSSILGFAIVLPICLLFSIGTANASPQISCSVSLTGTEPTSPVSGTSYSTVGYDVTCNFIPLNEGSIWIMAPGDGGMFLIPFLPSYTSTVALVPVSQTLAPCVQAGGYGLNFMPTYFKIHQPPGSPAYAANSATCTQSIGVQSGGIAYPPTWESTASGYVIPPDTQYPAPAGIETWATWLATGTGIFAYPHPWYTAPVPISASVTTVTGYFGVAGPCGLSGYSGFSSSSSSGTFGFSNHQFSFDTVGVTRTVELVANVDPVYPSTALTPPNYSASKNFTTIGSENSPGTKSYVYDFVGKPVPQSDGTSSISVNIDESNTTAGDLPTSITAWCYAPDFGWVSWGNVFALSPLVPIVPLTPPTGPPTTGLAGCISSDGLGLNPSSWIPGLLNMGACVLQDLFIPSQSNLTSLAQTFGITNNTPTYGSLPASQWLGGMAKALVTLPAATVSTLQTDADTGSGQCGLDGMSSMQLHDNTGHNVGPSINECYFLTAVSANTTVANGWNYIDIALTGLIYLIAALAIFFIFRSVLSGNGGS